MGKDKERKQVTPEQLDREKNNKRVRELIEQMRKRREERNAKA